jgi:hypothetical protein
MVKYSQRKLNLLNFYIFHCLAKEKSLKFIDNELIDQLLSRIGVGKIDIFTTRSEFFPFYSHSYKGKSGEIGLKILLNENLLKGLTSKDIILMIKYIFYTDLNYKKYRPFNFKFLVVFSSIKLMELINQRIIPLKNAVKNTKGLNYLSQFIYWGLHVLKLWFLLTPIFLLTKRHKNDEINFLGRFENLNEIEKIEIKELFERFQFIMDQNINEVYVQFFRFNNISMRV